MKMINEQISPLIKLRRQNTIRLFRFDIPWTQQPNSVITHWRSTTNPDICQVHQIQQEVVQATACNKYFFTFHNVTLVESVVQYAPPLLNYPKSALHILANALDVCEKYPSGDKLLVQVKGQIVVGQRKYPLSQMRYIPFS